MLLQPFIQAAFYLVGGYPGDRSPQLNLLQLFDQYRSAYPERLQGIFLGVLQDLGSGCRSGSGSSEFRALIRPGTPLPVGLGK